MGHDRQKMCTIKHVENPSESIREAVQNAVRKSGAGARRFELDNGLRPWSLRGILDPRRKQSPSVDRAAEICRALGLEFYIGPPRDAGAPGDPRPSVGADAGDVLEMALRQTEKLADELRTALSDTRESSSAQVYPGAYPVPVHRLRTAAGAGALDLDEEVATYAWFQREWLRRRGLVATRCSVIGVTGESMEPTLPDGCSILVDRSRTRRRPDGIFLVRTDDGLVVKRAGRDDAGAWELLSDHPSWPPLPWPDDADVIGQIRWMAMEL